MSRHSKWSQIKRQKGVADNKRSAVFTKLCNAITIAAREHGGNPEANFKLRLAIDKARETNVPKDNIERAIKRGTGELAGGQIEEVVFEAFGPGGAAIVIETLTDNKNRSLGDIKSVLKKYNANLTTNNSALRLFARQGVIRLSLNKITDREAAELKIIESGAEDVKTEEDELVVFTLPQQLQTIQEKLTQANLPIDSAEVELVPQTTVSLPDSSAQNQIEHLLTELSECPDVNNVYTNLK